MFHLSVLKWPPEPAAALAQGARLTQRGHLAGGPRRSDARRLRTSFIDYEIIAGKHPLSAPELLDQPVQQPVVVLLGPDEVTFPPDAVARCRLAYPDLIGPFLVPDSGHFMQWEQPATVASALRGFFGRRGNHP